MKTITGFIIACFLLTLCPEKSKGQTNAMNIIEDVIQGLAAATTPQHSILNLYNNTGKDIYFAVAFYDNNNQCWSSKGWYFVKAYNSRNLDFGGYLGKIYIHGYRTALFGLAEKDWGSGFNFCIDRNNAFEIRNADKINCKYKNEFSEFDISSGVNNWSFNP